MGVEEFLDFMPDTVTVNAKTGQSVSAAASFSTVGVDYPARIEMKNHLVVGVDGRTVTARGRIYMGTTTAPGLEDKVTLPVGFTPRIPPIISVNLVSDESGPHHVVLEIG